MVRRCDADFGLTADGDRIAVGLSGGVDLALVHHGVAGEYEGSLLE